MRKTHLQMAEVSSKHFAEQLEELHNTLSQVYVLVNRPLDIAAQDEACSKLTKGMSVLRGMREDQAYIQNSLRGIDSDFSEVQSLIDKIRGIPESRYKFAGESTGRWSTRETIDREAVDDPNLSPMHTESNRLADHIAAMNRHG